LPAVCQGVYHDLECRSRVEGYQIFDRGGCPVLFLQERSGIMRQRVILLGVAGAAVMLAAGACGQESGQQEQAAIRLVAESFVKAYNRGDSQAIAQLFTPEALIVGANGVSTHGREAIEQVFAEVFKRHPQTQMKIVIGAIRAVSPGVAIEEGTRTVSYTSGEPAEQGRYVVVHVLRDGQWRMASARDVTAEPLPAEEQL